MAWQTTGDVIEFLAAAGGCLRRERARNTIILSVTETMRLHAAGQGTAGRGTAGRGTAGRGTADANPDGPLLGWFTDPAGAVAGAFMHTPPFPVVLTDVAPEAAVELAMAMALAGRPLGGVNARPDVAAAFADGWRAGRPGGRAEVFRRQRLYRLGELAWPDPVPGGAARLGRPADAALAGEWFAAFAVEVGDLGREIDQAAEARAKLEHDGLTLWEDDGAPVSLACNTVPVDGMVRIGPVYTPPERRGRGYASAVTAAVSERLLGEGAEEVLLYTDLANPVSNSIYQRIGYRAVEDRVVLSFMPG